MNDLIIRTWIELPPKEYTFISNEAGSNEWNLSRALVQAIRVYELYLNGGLVRKEEKGGGCGDGGESTS